MASSNWALSQLSKLLPLDEDSLKQILDHSSTLSADDAVDNFKNLLGDSPQALEFISSFNSRRHATSSQQSSSQAAASDASPAKGRPKKKKAPLNKLPAPRRPDDYGNTEGAYHKKDIADEYMPASRARKDATANTFALSSTPAARQQPTTSSLSMLGPSMPNVHSRNASPSKASRSSTPASTSRTSSPKPPKSTKVTIAGGAPMHGASSTLSDLESAIRSLEMSTNPSIPPPDPALRRCPCMGTMHPLLAAAPNCISCGKVVCAKEGLAPCTFCGTPLLTPLQVQDMVRALREERGREKMSINNAGQKRAEISGAARPFQNASTANTQQNTEELEKAQAHRDRLLGFQASNAARTKVVDEAASFETPDMGVSQWGSAEQRAAQLKKQQRVLREMEWNARPEYERRKVVVSLDVVGGKVVRRMGHAEAGPPRELGGDGEDEENAGGGGGGAGAAEGRTSGGAFSKNPLLGKLIRPTWSREGGDDESSGGEDKGKGKEVERVPRERSQLWRRVQDDNDDSEEYILNGGIYGGRESERILGAEEQAYG